VTTPSRPSPFARAQRVAARALPWLMAVLAASALAQGADGTLDAQTLQRIQALGEEAGATLAGGAMRVEIEPGRLDPRLRLAPCERIEPYLPPGARPWGRSRVGLRCAQGPTPWNVYLPVTVKVFAQGWVAAVALPAGSELQPDMLRQAEVDWAAAPTPPALDAGRLVGRQLARPVAAGAAVRLGDLKQRQWFAAGDTVQLVARGNGFSVSGEGQAMSPGVEGQPVRVRTDNGRVLTGQPVGHNRVEVQL
jgi:flagella basal body P-ring formation protein FlgA